MAVMLTPWGRERFLAYNGQLYERMHMPGVAPMASAFYTGPLVLFSLAIGLGVCGFVVWFLQRHREAFTDAKLDQAAG